MGEKPMDWSRTKIVFIVIFLVLDVFLFVQYHQKQRSIQFEYLTHAPMEAESTISKENLEKLPQDSETLTYVSATPKIFNRSDLSKLSTSNQNLRIVSKNILRSTLKKPYSSLKINDIGSMKSFMSQYVFRASQYEFWSYEKNSNKIIFIQTYEGYPIYNNQFGRVEILLNDAKEVIGYLQTMLVDITFIGDEEKQPVVLSALEALKIIGEKNVELETISISDVKIGYYTYVPLTGTQVFTPTWYFKFNNGHSYFVNAIEGQIINDHLQLE